MRFFERVTNRWTHRVIANSEAVKRDAVDTENLPAEKIDVIYNGLELDAYDRVTAPPNSIERRIYSCCRRSPTASRSHNWKRWHTGSR